MVESSLNDPCPVCGERPNAIKTDFVPGAITFYHRSGRTFWFCTLGPEGKTSTRDRPGDAANYGPRSGPDASWWAKVAADRPGGEERLLTDEELRRYEILARGSLRGSAFERLFDEVRRLRLAGHALMPGEMACIFEAGRCGDCHHLGSIHFDDDGSSGCMVDNCDCMGHRYNAASTTAKGITTAKVDEEPKP